MKLRSWAGLLLVVAFLVTGAVWLGSRPVPEAPVYQGGLGFRTDQAMKTLRELVTNFPERDYRSQGRLRAAEWIAGEFGRLGLDVRTQVFSEVIAGAKVNGLRNVYAVLPGERPEAILVVGHYDIPPYVREGAADDASGVAATLELARVFADTRPRYTMIFLASDSEEYGAMWGSHRFLAASGWKDRLVAVVSLDYANMGPNKGIKVRSMGIQQGYTPLWLRQLALASAAGEGPAVDVDPVMEWVERSVTVAPTEHGVYLQAGIPAVDLWGIPRDQARQSRLYHTKQDTLDNILPGTMGRYGRAAERLVRSIQSLDEIPSGEMSYLKTGQRYLPGRVVLLLQLLLLVPLAGGVVAAWRAVARGLSAPVRAGRIRASEVWLEVRKLVALFLSGGLGYLVLWLCTELGWMVKYEMYPATQKDPVLDHPQLLPLMATLAAMVIGYLVLRWLLRAGGKVSPTATRAVCLSALLALSVVSAFFGGGFAVIAFLAPALILWPLVRRVSSGTGRVVNTLIALSGLVAFASFIVVFAKLYFIGYVWWYMLMAAAYGLFRARAVLAALLAAAVFVRFTVAASKGEARYSDFSWGSRGLWGS